MERSTWEQRSKEEIENIHNKSVEEKNAWSYLLKITAPIIIFLIFLYMCSHMGENTSPSTRQEYHAVGTIFKIDGARFVVTDTERIEGNESDTIIIKFDVENIGKEKITISSGMVKLIDNAERIYDSDAWGSSWPGSLNPGIKKSGKAAFEVPKNTKGLIAAFRADLFDFGGASYEYVRIE